MLRDHIIPEGTYDPNPSGLCMCGCGETTNLVSATRCHAYGIKPGSRTRFCKGHTTQVWGEIRYTVDPETGCWNWDGSMRRGYGIYTFRQKTRLAHIHMYEQTYGPVPEGLELDHTCRNTRCVNPDHNEAVTHMVNIQRGASTQLDHDKVQGIRAQYPAKTMRTLASEYGVCIATIHRIIHRVRWSNVEDAPKVSVSETGDSIPFVKP